MSSAKARAIVDFNGFMFFASGLDLQTVPLGKSCTGRGATAGAGGALAPSTADVRRKIRNGLDGEAL
jgi:hypothetical protein